VSTSNKIDIKPQASGMVTYVAVKPGDVVRQGQLIAQIDATDAKNAVIQAEQSLATSKLQYQKDTAQAPIDYQTAQNNVADATSNLVTEYDAMFNTLSTTYIDLPNSTITMNNVLYNYDLSPSKSSWNADTLQRVFTLDSNNQLVVPFVATAVTKNTTAHTAYAASIAAFKSISRASPTDTLEQTLTDAITTTTAVADTLQAEVNMLGEITDLAAQQNVTYPTVINTLLTNARSALSSVNADLTSLLAEKRSLANAKQAVITAQNALTLITVGNTTTGANPISLQISANSIASSEANLEKLRRDLADHSISAPFDGTISSVNAVRGDSAPATVATIITAQKIAQLTLNEVDAAKVHLGDKATLTFDAVDGLTLTGKVAEIDSVGTVSQGVVSYAIKINFDTQDDRIKSGMTVNASIQTQVKQDVLMVPSSAVKTSNGVSHVSVFTPALVDTGGAAGTASNSAPAATEVTVGISDDTNVEIVTGLTEGQQIVTRTILGTATTATPATTQNRGAPSIRL
jgi:RND family efflux transporter MFP subunit